MGYENRNLIFLKKCNKLLDKIKELETIIEKKNSGKIQKNTCDFAFYNGKLEAYKEAYELIKSV